MGEARELNRVGRWARREVGCSADQGQQAGGQHWEERRWWESADVCRDIPTWLSGAKHLPNKEPVVSHSTSRREWASAATVRRPRVSLWPTGTYNLFQQLYFIYPFTMSEGAHQESGFVNGRCYPEKAPEDGPPLYHNGDFRFQGAPLACRSIFVVLILEPLAHHVSCALPWAVFT